MTIDTDMHSHLSRSSALQMAMAAQQKDYEYLAFLNMSFKWKKHEIALHHLEPEGPLLTFSKYIGDVLAAATQANVEIRLGLEVDFIPEKNELIYAFILENKWDFLIGSVHEINGFN